MDRATIHATLLLMGYTNVLSFDEDNYTFYRHPTRQSLWVDADNTIHRGNANLGPEEVALNILREDNNDS